MSETPAPIIIIGAARSGTHLLATMLQESIDCAYAGEVNDLWRNIPRVPKHDAFPAELATETTCKSLRQRLDNLRQSQGKEVLLEKTAANSLRMPFVYRVFPDARYIHIIRDGRDVACSARKKYQGDARKQTSGTDQKIENTSRRASRLVSLVKHKLANGLSAGQLVRNPGRYLNGALSVLGIRKKVMWGPRFPGMADAFRDHPLLDVGALQWQCSVDAITEFTEKTQPKHYIEMTFEALMQDPEAKLNAIMAFLGDGVPLKECEAILDIRPQSTTWRQTLSENEIQRLEQLIGSTLSRHGYQNHKPPALLNDQSL